MTPVSQMNRACHYIAIFSLFVIMAVQGNAQDHSGLRTWDEYRTIMWISDVAYKQPEKIPLFYQRMREMGINTAMVFGAADPAATVTNQFPYYVENLVNRGLCLKFSSKVTDWDKFVTTWVQDGRPESAFVRDYCLDDPQWRRWARTEVQNIARRNREHSPIAYNLRDELSTTISANPFDYDFNPIALTGFREWLRTQYKDLAGLNAEWDSSFTSWDEVVPFSTDQVKNRMSSGKASPKGKPDWGELAAMRFEPVKARESLTRWNFSPWADFRTYMDLSLARALDDLRHAAHEVDSQTPVGIEGTQMAHAFGGYDLWRMSQVLDWVEPYDIGNAREIFGSFMPGNPLMTTVFESDTEHARRRLWHLLLEGDRGCIVWWSDDCIDWKSSDYSLTAKAKALAPVLKELQSPLACLLLRAHREYDPVFVHYSQPSIQVDWLLESTVDGSSWHRRFSSFEADHNRMAKVRDAWVKAFQDLGYSPRFVSSSQVEEGKLSGLKTGVLVLPSAWAMSDLELDQIRSFVNATSAPHEVFFDGTPGQFDQHGKLRAVHPPGFSSTASAVCCLTGRGKDSHAPVDIATYSKDRLKDQPSLWLAEWIRQHTKLPAPEIRVSLPERVRIHKLTLGSHRIVAFERNIGYHMSEQLAQAGGNDVLEKPGEVEARLGHAMHVYDLRTEKYIGQVDRIDFNLNPWEPSVFALSEEKLPDGPVVTQLLERLKETVKKR